MGLCVCPFVCMPLGLPACVCVSVCLPVCMYVSMCLDLSTCDCVYICVLEGECTEKPLQMVDHCSACCGAGLLAMALSRRSLVGLSEAGALVKCSVHSLAAPGTSLLTLALSADRNSLLMWVAKDCLCAGSLVMNGNVCACLWGQWDGPGPGALPHSPSNYPVLAAPEVPPADYQVMLD